MARSRKPARRPPAARKARLYTFEVFLLSGNLSNAFVAENPVVSRTIQMRGDQTLWDLHRAIFDAYGRWEEHSHEFQLGGKGPMDPAAARYVLPRAYEVERHEDRPPAGRVDQTTLDALGLKEGDQFGYWFDFGDDWWHQVNVEAVADEAPRGKYPKVIGRVGDSPPQYPAEDEEDDEEDEDEPGDVSLSEAADAACLVGEGHLRKGEYEKAVEAFTRAIESHPTADAYQGRASAHRALAERDEAAARASAGGATPATGRRTAKRK